MSAPTQNSKKSEISENVNLKRIKTFSTVDKKKSRKSHKKLTGLSEDFSQTQNLHDDEIPSSNTFIKRKSHRNKRKRKKSHSHPRKKVNISNSSPLNNKNKSVEGFIESVNLLTLQNPLNQTLWLQTNKSKNFRLHRKPYSENDSDYDDSNNNGVNNKNRSENNDNYEEDAITIMSNENIRQQLMEQKEERKSLQVKRELRRKHKLERMKQKQRKRKKIKNAGTFKNEDKLLCIFFFF